MTNLNKIQLYLLAVGVDPANLGFHQLSVLIDKYRPELSFIDGNLSEVSEYLGTTTAKLERNIRHAIRTSQGHLSDFTCRSFVARTYIMMKSLELNQIVPCVVQNYLYDEVLLDCELEKAEGVVHDDV